MKSVWPHVPFLTSWPVLDDLRLGLVSNEANETGGTSALFYNVVNSVVPNLAGWRGG
jgi:hypothetical protein